jgi:hypothetical protein
LLFNCFIAQVFRRRENHRGFECGEGENVDRAAETAGA